MSERTGILALSPLKFVLASVRFAPWPIVSKKIDEIQDKLRDILPLVSSIQQLQTAQEQQFIVDGASPNVWMLMSADRSTGMQVTADQVLFFTRKYNRYDGFKQLLERGLGTLLEHMQFMDVLNAGSRYVDCIEVSDGEQFSQYIAESLLPAQVPGYTNIGGETLSVFQLDDSELRVRCITAPNVPDIPVDLFSVVAFSADPSKPIQIELLKSRRFLLDIDAVKQFQEASRMRADEVLQLLDRLHKSANAFFRDQNVCTEHAFRVWKGGEA